MYYPRPLEGYLTRRNVFVLNAIGLLGIWLATLARLGAGDTSSRNIERFLVISGGMLAAFASVMAGLGSKRTTDIQNLGLLLWAGLVLLFTFQIFNWINTTSI